ncbi:RNA-directed DNA polymerase from mobile element jockey-like [Brachionus plicatilis]|uniref:RNA-directed DNA polymerase from mobile element jockey-like n=1 Tax=Brachionus plicatilis TaxID=10195 RepID=A0A3M7SAD4_BRAPC|nr:RNA-directed DNA polymerase from mobile element jockey-like [Brachionus plicatilis]
MHSSTLMKKSVVERACYQSKKNIKARNRHGGGIAMLVRDNVGKCRASVLYNPPNTVLHFKLFLEISSRFGKFIIGGDFNAKSKSLGCFGENENGLILEEIFSKLNLSAINDATPTYSRFKTDHFEVLDLFLIPSSLSDKVLDFKVLIDHDMLSDHFPIQTCISTEYLIAVEPLKTSLNFKKANWELKRDLLKSSNQHISSLILPKKVRLALKEFWNQNWQDFINKMGKNTLSSSREPEKKSPLAIFVHEFPRE